MASVFIKVDPKERLPRKYGSYICLYNNSKNVQVTVFDRRSTHDFWRESFDYWLEEVELPENYQGLNYILKVLKIK